MGDQGKKSSMQALAAGFLGFIVVVGLGGVLILRRGGASTEAPAVSYAPVDVDSGPRSPVRAASNLAAPGSSPAPLLSDEVRDESAASAGSAAGAAAAAAPAGDSAAGRPLVGSRLDAAAPGSSSAEASVSVSTSAAVALKTKESPAGAKKPFLAPKLDLSRNQGTLASTIHYGVSDRAELMGRAAGPVYNFSGKSAGLARGGQVAADNSAPSVATGAMRQIDAAQKQLDASDISAEDKAKVDQNLNAVRRSADSGSEGQ